jgi:hypothetical protein
MGKTAFFLQVLGIDAHDRHPGVVRDAGMGERLVDGFVGVLELDVLAHDPDLDLVGGRNDAPHDLLPDIFRRQGMLEAKKRSSTRSSMPSCCSASGSS